MYVLFSSLEGWIKFIIIIINEQRFYTGMIMIPTKLWKSEAQEGESLWPSPCVCLQKIEH